MYVISVNAAVAIAFPITFPICSTPFHHKFPALLLPREHLLFLAIFDGMEKRGRLSGKRERDCLLAGVFNSVPCNISDQAIAREESYLFKIKRHINYAVETRRDQNEKSNVFSVSRVICVEFVVSTGNRTTICPYRDA